MSQNERKQLETGKATPRGESAGEESGRVIVIGGGPAGLSAAYELTLRGKKPLVLEKYHAVGGLARTERFHGNYFDLGGHRFYTQMPEIERFWREILGDDLLRRPRLSRIYYRKRFFHYPLKPLNALRGLGAVESLLILLSYLRWQIFPCRPEESFEQWVTNRFGNRLFRIFFKSYTEKVWGIPCHRLRAEWAAQRIKDLSLKSALAHMFLRSTKSIRTLIGEFDYPRLGPGMMWQAVQAAIERQGGEVRLDADVVAIQRHANRRWSVRVTSAGRTEQVEAEALISSMPITEFIKKLEPRPPAEVLDAAGRLTYRDFLTVCLIINRPDLFPDNWIYVHDPAVSVARIQNFKNWSPDMVADLSKSTLGLEYFCTEGDALWSLPDKELIELGRQELERIGLARSEDVEQGCVFRVPKAYPIYDSDYGDHLKVVRQFVEGLENFQTIGRNGLHRYNNQDHAMLTGMLAVRNLACGECHNLWQINGEQEYQEEVRV
ncbi:MAG: NAD(P)/FAD-dependent oxidoreductase [Pirellulaceae bacterium]